MDKEIIKMCKDNLNISWIKVLRKAIGGLYFQYFQSDLILPTSRLFKVKMAFFAAICLEYFEDSEIYKNFLIGVNLQKYWDDLFDNRENNYQEMYTLSKAILEKEGQVHSNTINEFEKMKKVYLYLIQYNKFSSKVTSMLKDEFINVIDAYYFERLLSNKKNFITEDLEKYKFIASTSIALKFMILIVGITTVESQEEEKIFLKSLYGVDKLAWTIRLANDRSSYDKEIKEKGINIYVLRMSILGYSFNDVDKGVLLQIKTNLDELFNLNTQNIYNNIERNILLLAVKRYISNTF